MKLQEENKILKSAFHVAQGQLCQTQNTLNDLEQYVHVELMNQPTISFAKLVNLWALRLLLKIYL